MLVQEGKVLAPSLKGDVHLLESYAIFPSTSGGWSGSYYFSIAAHEQLELKLASFQERGCSQIFLWSLMLDLSSARESTHLYPSWNTSVFTGFHFYVMTDGFPFSLKSPYIGSVQSLPSVEFTSHTPKSTLSFEEQKWWKAKKCACVGEIPISAIHLISACQLPHLSQYINNASPWGWLLSLEFAVCKCFSIPMNSVIKVPLAGPVLSSLWLRKNKLWLFGFLVFFPLFRLRLILPRNFCVSTPDFHIQSR